MKNTNILTPKQQETLTYLKNYILKHDQAPFLSEIKKHFKLNSTRSVTQRLDALEKKGYIVRDHFKRRGLRVVGLERDVHESGFIQLPVIASVGCDNETIFAQDQDVSEYLSVDKKLIANRDVVAMKAVGNSMIDAGVNNGDYVLIEKTESVKTGDRVVAIVNEMAVLKKLQEIENGYVLHAEAKGYAPIILNSDAKIFGKLISIIPMSVHEEVEEDITIVPV